MPARLVIEMIMRPPKSRGTAKPSCHSGLVMSPTTTPMPVETIQTSQTSAPEPRKCHMRARSSVSSGWVMARAKAWSIRDRDR